MNLKQGFRFSGLALPGAALLLSACGGGSVGSAAPPNSAGAPTQGTAQQGSLAPSATSAIAGSEPVGSAAAGKAAPKAYVGLFKDNAVGVIDTATQRELTTIPVPAGPHGLVMTPD
ncbi:MAG TPA: hypothetical protein VKU60_06130, partial [Chloroflexota bacterium]|nr:hypothetical protein [Chloroflexota bacterium]